MTRVYPQVSVCLRPARHDNIGEERRSTYNDEVIAFGCHHVQLVLDEEASGGYGRGKAAAHLQVSIGDESEFSIELAWLEF